MVCILQGMHVRVTLKGAPVWSRWRQWPLPFSGWLSVVRVGQLSPVEGLRVHAVCYSCIMLIP